MISPVGFVQWFGIGGPVEVGLVVPQHRWRKLRGGVQDPWQRFGVLVAQSLFLDELAHERGKGVVLAVRGDVQFSQIAAKQFTGLIRLFRQPARSLSTLT